MNPKTHCLGHPQRLSTILTVWTAMAYLWLPLHGALAAPPGFTRQSISVNGSAREYFIHIPCDHNPDVDPPMPVIMAFHGGNASGRQMALRWQRQTNQGKVIVCPSAEIFPPTGKTKWRHATAKEPAPDPKDVDLVKALVAFLRSQPSVAPDLFYATGFSSGAGMTWQLAVLPQFSDVFRGFGPVARTIDQIKIRNVRRNRPLPVIYIHGTVDNGWFNDPNVLQESGKLSPHQTVQWLLTFNGNDKLQVQEGCYPDLGGAPYRAGSAMDLVIRREQTVVVRQHYPAGNPENVNEGAAVTFLAVVGGGHSWPRYDAPPLLATHCRDIDAADEIVRFWRQEAGMP